jgi:hypothetical protein
VRDRLARLRHDAVVGGDHEDRNVGDFCAACAHRGERFVTGRIDEGDLAIVFVDGVRTDFLRDAARFAGGNGCRTDLVEQRRLTVVDVTEHGDDRRTRREQFGFVFFLLDDDLVARFFDDRVEAELARDGRSLFARNVLVDRRHRAHAEQLFDDVGSVDDHRSREFLHGQNVGDFDRFEFGRRRLDDAVDHAAALALTLLLEQHLRLAVFLRLVAIARVAALTGTSAAGRAGTRARALTRG